MLPKKAPIFSSISIFAVVLLLVSLQIGEGSAGPSKLTGKYIYDNNPYNKNVHKLLLEYGFDLEDLESIHHLAAERTREISFMEGDTVKITEVTRNGSHAQDFISGREVDEPYLLDKPEYVARTIASVEGDKIIFKRRLAKKNKHEMTEVLDCHDDGCTSTLFFGKEKVTIHWKRLN